MPKPAHYLVSFSVWNAAIGENVARNYQPLELSDTIATVNELIEKGRKEITIDELAPGAHKLTGQVVKRWGASELLVANSDVYPIRGADPDSY